MTRGWRTRGALLFGFDGVDGVGQTADDVIKSGESLVNEVGWKQVVATGNDPGFHALRHGRFSNAVAVPCQNRGQNLPQCSRKWNPDCELAVSPAHVRDSPSLKFPSPARSPETTAGQAGKCRTIPAGLEERLYMPLPCQVKRAMSLVIRHSPRVSPR